jgi:hypothetical protein
VGGDREIQAAPNNSESDGRMSSDVAQEINLNYNFHLRSVLAGKNDILPPEAVEKRKSVPHLHM